MNWGQAAVFFSLALFTAVVLFMVRTKPRAQKAAGSGLRANPQANPVENDGSRQAH
jgi:hypothetical protein